MKVLIFSDTHHNFDEVDKMINKYKPDRIYGLGDFGSSEIELDIRGIIGVRGNDYYDSASLPYNYIDEIDGFKILFTHGHNYSVKYSLLRLKMFMVEQKIDVCFYGHTHVASIIEDNNLYFINPGSASLPSFPRFPTVILMDTSKNKLDIKIVDTETMDIFNSIIITK